MPLLRIPTTLITGATGAGKTTLISRALNRRPAAERWAVLVNDSGRTRLEDSPAIDSAGVVVREVVGCICCTAQVSLRTALVSLLRAARPHRLLIEASSAAEPAAVIRVLDEPGLAQAVDLRSTLCAVDAAQLGDARYRENAVYRAQIAAADGIVLANAGIAGGARYAEVLAQLARIRPTASCVIDADDSSPHLDVL